jgi:hypothetical protein
MDLKEMGCDDGRYTQLAKTLPGIGNNNDESSDYITTELVTPLLLIITRWVAKQTYIFQKILMKVHIFFIIIFML